MSQTSTSGPKQAAVPYVPRAPKPDRTEAMAQLALDFVRELMTPEEACKRNGFEIAEAAQLLKNSSFMQLMQQLRAEWNDTTNAAHRAQIRAGVALEDGVAQLYRMMHGEGQGPDGKLQPVQVEAVKALARIAGVGVGSGAVAALGPGGVGPIGGQTFKVVFNFQTAAPQIVEGLPVTAGELERPPEEEDLFEPEVD